MADSALKSAQITNLDDFPVVRGTNGQDAAGSLQIVTGGVTALDGDSTSSTYKLVRFPTAAVVKRVDILSRIASAGAGDINIAFSDSTTDGTPSDKQGTIPQLSAANNKLFGAAQSLVLSGVWTEKTHANAYMTNARYEMPMWQVLGYSADPGGFFDLQINITTQVTTGGQVEARVWYVMP